MNWNERSGQEFCTQKEMSELIDSCQNQIIIIFAITAKRLNNNKENCLLESRTGKSTNRDNDFNNSSREKNIIFKKHRRI